MSDPVVLTGAKTRLLAYVRSFNSGRGHGIRRVADLLHVSPYTVEAWLKPSSTKSSLPVPSYALDALEQKLGKKCLER